MADDFAAEEATEAPPPSDWHKNRHDWAPVLERVKALPPGKWLKLTFKDAFVGRLFYKAASYHCFEARKRERTVWVRARA